MADEDKKNQDMPATDLAVETPDTPAETPETTPEATPAKHKYADRLSKAYPDREFKSDEDYDSGMNDYLSELEGYVEKGKSSSNKLIALFEAEPQVGEIVRDCINGCTFREALARHVSPEDLIAVEGDPDYEGWSKNKASREEGKASKQKQDEEYQKNISTSEQAITAYVEKNGMTPEEADDFFGRFDTMLENVGKGIITEADLDAWMKALKYDTDIVAATEQGKIAGRNENIVAKKANTSNAGDGLPRPSKVSQEPDTPQAAPNYMDELVKKTKSRDVFA